MTRTQTQTYRMDVDGEQGEHFKAATPAKALREYWGDRLAEQSGRYGKLKDGRSVVALLSHGGRKYRGGHEWGR